jgi:palmitoyltransferase ZDHHC6
MTHGIHTGIELPQEWPPSDPTDRYIECTQPDTPWTYDNDGPNPALVPSNSHSAQQLRARKRGGRGGRSRSLGVSAVPPFHPDYEPAHDREDHGDDGDDGGERFAEYEDEPGWGGTRHVRRGSEGYEVRAIDREQLLEEYIASRGQEEGYYRRYVPEPPSETESESESGGEGGDGPGVGQVEVEVEDEDDDDDDDEDEVLAVRVEKWRSGEAIS